MNNDGVTNSEFVGDDGHRLDIGVGNVSVAIEGEVNDDIGDSDEEKCEDGGKVSLSFESNNEGAGDGVSVEKMGEVISVSKGGDGDIGVGNENL